MQAHFLNLILYMKKLNVKVEGHEMLVGLTAQQLVNYNDVTLFKT